MPTAKNVPTPNRFTVRVYGFLLNDMKELLVSREQIGDMHIIKFPGGGMELGEGPRDALVREVKEELGIETETGKLIYVTDFFVQSALDPKEQVMGIYYLLRAKNGSEADGIDLAEKGDNFRGQKTAVSRAWIPWNEIEEPELTFAMDRAALKAFKRCMQKEKTGH